ncbi:activating signal cointegrator 1 complex subunit 1-like [Eurytemora carolleeae]|uniref:activating signal cointegrator 1 complex subunit 1-like n=1 Tax=Eurytemora carolleeae TaxID=1294199 RepID=UPI000C76D578|nr:activating signal cointegrator 1 complex subunit 1-like [Eurytemora carolleeae]|eukprot:XP_023319708.1 activating signal cointegrator 1 complex subunit 1-like [Eurytemora affinis]
MALFDERERCLARDILQDCKETLILPLQGETPFQVEISGLEIMNDDPSEVDVLYAKVGQADQLQDVAEKIIDRFVESGLMKREYERIKFHVTLMNTLFRKDKNDVGDVNEPAGKSARETFDSRQILELYGNTSFGSVEISEIHLSQRRAGRRTPEGYYLPTAILNIVSCG